MLKTLGPIDRTPGIPGSHINSQNFPLFPEETNETLISSGTIVTDQMEPENPLDDLVEPSFTRNFPILSKSAFAAAAEREVSFRSSRRSEFEPLTLLAD